MDRLMLFAFIGVLAISSRSCADTTAANVVLDIYRTCLSELSTSCIKPKALAWMSKVSGQDVIKITDDLSIVRTSADEPADFSQQRSSDPRIALFDKVDNFLATHALKLKAPEALKSKEARSLFPSSYLQDGLATGVQVPLTDGNAVEGRGFVKKVMLPFLLGLKFKTTVLVPLALALIALKTWKAMTLGLLSLVLSGALVIFKIANPKVVNYEVVHYPHHLDHHVDHIPHHLEHHVDHLPHHVDHIPHHVDHIPHHVEHIEHVDHIAHAPAAHGWEPHGWARQFDAQQMAYGGQIPNTQD